MHLKFISVIHRKTMVFGTPPSVRFRRERKFAMTVTAATSRTRGSSCTHAESVPPPAAAPDSPRRVTRLINAVGGLIGGGALCTVR